MILRDVLKDDYKKVKILYNTAFPSEERAPFFMMKSRVKKQRGKLLVADDKGEFVGFVYLVCLENLVYVYYLAISSECRGKGYGSEVLRLIQEKYKGNKIFLAREQLDPKAENFEQRKGRHEFYLKNGFEDLPCCIKEASVVYDVMGVGGNVSANEYKALIAQWAGPIFIKLVDMRIIEK